MQNEPVIYAGADLATAKKALVMLHGRGAQAEDILALADHLKIADFALAAPQAAGNTWYPYSFMAPIAENEPWLSSALAKVAAVVKVAVDGGVPLERIFVCGFSQGACLSSEFIARNPARYGGLVAFTGGLIGPADADLHHAGNLAGMPTLFSSGDPDPHVPWSRVLASAKEFTAMGAEVETQRYPGRPHTVLPQEIKAARELIFQSLA